MTILEQIDAKIAELQTTRRVILELGGTAPASAPTVAKQAPAPAPAPWRRTPEEKAAAPAARSGTNGTELMLKRRTLIARYMVEKGGTVSYKDAKENSGVPNGSMTVVLDCDWFEQTAAGWTITQVAKDYLKQNDRG